jgi:hypothetical protein
LSTEQEKRKGAEESLFNYVYEQKGDSKGDQQELRDMLKLANEELKSKQLMIRQLQKSLDTVGGKRR